MKVYAETEGFEPSKQFPVYTLSKRTSSATRAGLRVGKNKNFNLTIHQDSKDWDRRDAKFCLSTIHNQNYTTVNSEAYHSDYLVEI